MTLKKELFALQVVKSGGDITKAAEEMGITNSLAKRYMKSDEVQEYVAELNKDIEKVCKINKAVVVNKVLDLAEKSEDAEQLGNARACYADISKMMGYSATADTQISINNNTIKIIALPEEDVTDAIVIGDNDE